MKAKSDFVTNSSSCAFIMIGWNFKKSDMPQLDEEDLYKDYPTLSISSDSDGGAREGEFLVGIEVEKIDDYMENDSIRPIQELLADEELNRFRKDFDIKDPIKLISSVRTC